MNYIGDFVEDFSAVSFKFLTHEITGNSASIPVTLSGIPVISVYKNGSLIQSVAGVTLIVDFDGVTGLNDVVVDLSSDEFYEANQDYQVVITTGTVGGNSIVGKIVAAFSIENRSGERALNVGYDGYIHVDTLNGTAGTVDYTNGIVSNPVDNIADARALAISLGINQFFIRPGSSITLASAFTNYLFEGSVYTVALGGQDISGSILRDADIRGIASGPPSVHFHLFN
jgi:hypothetical protein